MPGATERSPYTDLIRERLAAGRTINDIQREFADALGGTATALGWHYTRSGHWLVNVELVCPVDGERFWLEDAPDGKCPRKTWMGNFGRLEAAYRHNAPLVTPEEYHPAPVAFRWAEVLDAWMQQGRESLALVVQP